MKSILLVTLLIFTFSSFSQPTAKEVIKKANDKMQGTSSKGVMTMKIVRPKWTREISLKSWTMGNDYSLMLITAPARDKGTGFLKRERELWNWQPTIDRVVKMPPSMMMQSWMGSDFTNDDLVRQSSVVEDYTHEIEKDTTINNMEAWKIVLIPKEDAPVVWGMVEAYISKAEYYQLLFKYYDEDGFLINTMVMSDIKQMGDRKIPTLLEMIPAENPEQKTMIKYEHFEFDIPMDKAFFSIAQMKKTR